MISYLLITNLYNANKNNNHFSKVDNIVDEITDLNNIFDLYLETTYAYKNFTEIQKKLNSFQDTLKNKILNDIEDKRLARSLNKLQSAIEKKFQGIKKIQSKGDTFSNSLHVIQIYNSDISDNLNDIFKTIMTIDTNKDINPKQELKKLKERFLLYEPHTREISFLNASKKVLEHKLSILNIKSSIKSLNVDKKLREFNHQYKQYLQETTQKAYLLIGILSLLLVIAIIVSIYREYKLIILNTKLASFKRTVDSSDSTVIITDQNKVIKYVNKAFTKSTGYTVKEAIGKTPNIVNSGIQSDEFYKKLHQTIDSGEIWRGELINLDKMGMLIYEKATIIPIYENGKIVEYTAIKLDITKEKLANQKLQEKEKLLIQQSKMASMGEMLENIAHQWRQPLNVISTAATGILISKEYGLSTENKEIETLNNINESAQYLSQTINDFKNFFKEKTTKDKFSIKKACEKTIRLIESKLQSSDIKIIYDIKDIQIYGSRNEFKQIIMNILSNANDALQTNKKDQDRFIFINLEQTKSKAILTIKDSGGGIPENIIERIFEPYFTTKHKAQGTGIGLYMSMEIVRKHMNGTISVKNETYYYNGSKYIGASFTISLPIKKIKEDKKQVIETMTC